MIFLRYLLHREVLKFWWIKSFVCECSCHGTRNLVSGKKVPGNKVSGENVPEKAFSVKGIPGKSTEESWTILIFLSFNLIPRSQAHQNMLNAYPTIPHKAACRKRASGDFFPGTFFHSDFFSEGPFWPEDLSSGDFFPGFTCHISLIYSVRHVITQPTIFFSL